ncbi:MAG: glycosyltransferase [Caldilineae bacterium]|nr:MAG: glycosyltransferase [Caldilineae bacterium]
MHSSEAQTAPPANRTSPAEPLRVLQIVLNLDRAGAQEVVRTLTDYLQTEGCTVTVCAFRDGPMRAELEKLGVSVKILRRPRYDVFLLPLFLWELRRIRLELAQLVNDYRIEVVQTHLLEVLDFVALSLLRNTSAKVVLWTIHNVNFLPAAPQKLLRARRAAYRWLYRWLVKWASGFVAVSDEVQRAILRQLGTSVEGKIFTIANGVDIRRYSRPGDKIALCRELNLPDTCRLAVTVGRLTEQKGHTHLIEAAADILARHPDTRFLFVGDGELREALQAQVKHAGLTEHIHFLGNRPDVPDLLAAADLFILPSLWEGLSVALLEAMAAGRPIVATAVSGSTQVMVDGATGLLVPPADSKSLARAVCTLLDAPERAVAMGQAARQRVALHYSAQKQAREHVALYRRLLAPQRLAREEGK